MIDYLLALALSLGFTWLIGSIGTRTLDGAISAMGQLVRGWRDDAWPRGVQEEDRDRPWGWGRPVARVAAPRATLHEAAGGAPTARVTPRITTR
jgi:hypothetical protein